MSKLWAVIVREYLATVKTKTFVIAVVLMPVLMSAAVAIPLLAEQHAAPAERRCVVVDRTEILFAPLSKSVQRHNARSQTEEKRAPRSDRYRVEAATPEADRQTQGHALSERVRSGDLFCFLEIDETAFDPGTKALRYYTATPTQLALPRWLENELEAEIHRVRLERSGIDAKVVARAKEPIALERSELYERSKTGKVVEAGERDPISDIGFPIGLAMMMFLAVMMGAGPLMQSVLEEKMQRIAEILVSSVPPMQLMLGKLLGACGVSFTLLGLYVGGGWIVVARLGYTAPLSGAEMVWVLVFQAIALVMYGSVFLAVGSACSDLKQSQTLMMPVMLVVMAPLLLLNLVVADPNSGLATGLSLVPFFTPLLMMLRVTLPPGAPLWQALLGVALSGAFAGLCVFAAARIFRIGMLAQGAAPKVREIVRWILRG